MLFFDPWFLLFMLPGLALSLWASHRVRSTFKRYAQTTSRSGLSGAQVAEMLVKRAGVSDVRIESTPGSLSDHYDPRNRILRLSREVHSSRSVAAIGVAAHEAGHAIQHAQDYRPMRLRSLIVRPASIGSNLGIFLAMFGLLLGWSGLLWVGTILFAAFVVFTLVTLPVERDASRRAVAALGQLGVLDRSELEGASKVLHAAGMTYLAAAATAVLQLVYFWFAAER